VVIQTKSESSNFTSDPRASSFWLRLSEGQVIALVTAAAALVFLPFLGSTRMFDPTDSFFIESAREMMEMHQFSAPLMNYEPWLDKPALDFLLIILSFKCFGINEFAGRLPSALAGILEVVVTYVLSRQLLSRRQALLAAAVLISLPLFVIVGRVSLTDEPLSLFLTTALLSLAIASIKQSPKALVPGYLALSLAVLTKGPFALALVGLITLSYFVVTDYRRIFKSILELKPLSGIACLAFLTLPYYVWAHIDTHGAFTASFFLRQNIGRMVGVLNHVREFWWYVPIALAGFFPWSLLDCFAGSLLIKLWRGRSTALSNRRRLLVFSCCWAIATFVFFSAIPTKLETYIIPLAPALAIFTGCFLDLLIRCKRGMPVVVVAVALLAAAVAGPIAVCRLFDRSGAYLPLELPGIAIVFCAAAGALYFVFRKKIGLAVATICGATAAVCAIFIPLLFAVYYASYQIQIDRLVDFAREHKANLAVTYFSLPSAMFHYGRKVPLIRNQEEMRAYAEASDGPQWLLISDDILSTLCWTDRSPRVVVHDGRWWLFAVGRNCKKENTVEWNGPSVGVYPVLKN
jgi:4-amino-4-deoxy-L-arabinose transferase-like glycosyltransferase